MCCHARLTLLLRAERRRTTLQEALTVIPSQCVMFCCGISMLVCGVKDGGGG